MTCKREKKTTFKTALCVAFSLYLPRCVYAMFAGRVKKILKNKRQNQQRSTCTLKTYVSHTHMESVSRAIFSVSHLIVHPKYVRIISRFSTCCATRSHIRNFLHFHRCCWNVEKHCTGWDLNLSLFFDLVLFLPFSNTVIAIGNYFQTRMTVQRTVYSGRWKCYLLLLQLLYFSFEYLDVSVKNFE